MDLLAVNMKHLSNTARQQARYVIVATVDEAVKAGKLSRHRLDGIELADTGRYSRKSFVFPTYEQVKFVADGGYNPNTKRAVGGAGLCVWLMRGCGLRIEEALAVCKEDFIEDGTVLRVAWQASGDGKKREPLKHRKPGEYRDVPVPSWLWEMVEDMPDEPLIPGNGRLFQRYGTIYFRFMRAAEAAGIDDGFTPHSLRHAFASAMQVSRIASDASFGRSREHALPAAQRAALRCPRPAGPPRGHGDLGLHGPPGSDATMMQLIPLRGLHHHCACWHRNASGSCQLHPVHHRQTQRATPGRHRSGEGPGGPPASSVASRARPGNEPLSLHPVHPRPRRRMFAAASSLVSHADGPMRRGRGRHASQSPTGGRSWPGSATRLGRSVSVITNLGSSLQASRTG